MSFPAIVIDESAADAAKDVLDDIDCKISAVNAQIETGSSNAADIVTEKCKMH
jgi:hypothetical protein